MDSKKTMEETIQTWEDAREKEIYKSILANCKIHTLINGIGMSALSLPENRRTREYPLPKPMLPKTVVFDRAVTRTETTKNSALRNPWQNPAEF